jgi:hypothetical protein
MLDIYRSKRMYILLIFTLIYTVASTTFNISAKTLISEDNNIYFDKNTIEAVEGEVFTLTVDGIEEENSIGNLQFSVDNSEIVKILKLEEVPNGIILKLLKPGKAVISAVTKDRSTECKISVKPFKNTKPRTKLNFYFGDLHSHTSYSDGKLTPEDAFKHAKENRKADFLAITDHAFNISQKEWFETVKAAEKNNEDGKFLAIPSYEGHYHLKTDSEDGRIIMNGNEAIGYNTLEKPYSINESDDSYSMISKYSRSVGMFPHPGEASGDSNLIWNAYDEYRQINPVARKIMRLSEVRNETSAYNMLHEACYTLALDKGWYISPAAISDNHKEGWTTNYNFRTVILAPELTRQHVYEAIKANRVYASEDNNLRLSFSVNNHTMGSKLVLNSERKYSINVCAEEPDKGDENNKISKLEIISDYGKIVYSKELDTFSIKEHILLSSETARYFFVRITKKDGKRAWSSPVWTGREFDAIEPREKKADRLTNSNWVITSRNISKDEALKAFDGNIETSWQSTSTDAELIVDFGSEEEVTAIGYIKHSIPLANETEANKLMAEYEYYISSDNKNWAKVANGTIRAFGREHYERFAPRAGRYIKIRAVRPLKGELISGGEFWIYRDKNFD